MVLFTRTISTKSRGRVFYVVVEILKFASKLKCPAIKSSTKLTSSWYNGYCYGFYCMVLSTLPGRNATASVLRLRLDIHSTRTSKTQKLSSRLTIVCDRSGDRAHGVSVLTLDEECQ